MPSIPLFSAPSVSLSPPTSLSVIAKSGASIAVPTLSAPSISIGAGSSLSSIAAVSRISSTIGGAPTTLAGAAATFGAPTTLAGAAATFGVPTTIGGISSAFGGPTSLSGVIGSTGLAVSLPNFAASLPALPSLKMLDMPSFPGLDKAGILLGAGPKFIAEKITKYTTIVPPFVPGLKINMAMIGGAIAIISALSSGNPSAILKSLVEDMVDQAVGDLKDQVGDAVKGALDQTGVSSLQDQVQGIQGDVESKVSAAVGDVQNGVSGATPENTSGGVANLNLSAVATPINNTLSGATSFTNDKITAFGIPPSG